MNFLRNGNKSKLNVDDIPLNNMSERIISMEQDNYLSHSVINFMYKKLVLTLEDILFFITQILF